MYLVCHPATLNRAGDVPCHLDHGPVEERSPNFEPARHTGPVHGDQVLTGQILLAVLVDQFIHGGQAPGLRHGQHQLLVRV